MRVQLFSSMPSVERSSHRVGWFNIDAYPKRPLLNEPTGQQMEQFGSHTAASKFRNHVDPLQLSITGVAAGKMARYETGDRTLRFCNKARSRCKALLRADIAVQVS